MSEIFDASILLKISKKCIMKSLKSRIIKFIQQPIPRDFDIIEQSIPIVFFGNIEKAEAATVSINPSWQEFLNSKNHKILESDKKRLIDRESLGKINCDVLSAEEAERVYESLLNYFNKKPYRRWFRKDFDGLFSSVGSYYNGTLLGLDIFPFATNKVWSKLEKQDKDKILKDKGSFIEDIISARNMKYLFVNGNTAKEAVSEHLKVTFQRPIEKNIFGRQIYFYIGQFKQCKIIAWSLYFQNARLNQDQTKALKEEIDSFISPEER